MPALTATLRRLRAGLGQLSWTIREYRDPRRLVRQLRVNRHLGDPGLPTRSRQPGSVWAVTVVRDEADVLGAVIDHLLGQDVAGILVADNGSTDGTWDLLVEAAAQDPRVHPIRDGWPRHDQAEKLTRLARLAGRGGADWIVPFDGDELWFAEGDTLGGYLRAVSRHEPALGGVYARWLNMVPTGPAAPVAAGTEFLLDATPIFPGKIAVRAHRLLSIAQGAHTAARVGGRRSGGLWVAHAIYRNPGQLARKLRQGAAAERRSGHPTAAHWEAGARLTDPEVQQIWDKIVSGGAAPELAIWARGPMVRVRPVGWSRWDPESQVPLVAD